MALLKLTEIKKTYIIGDSVTEALKGVSLEFRKNELVSILGPSGCGKTTLLNIIGGLDRYDSGDLVINDMTTKNYKDSDWDAYRNRSIGFVFQNYNLISHQTVLQNVEISMTLSGVSARERTIRAKEALASVGLSDQIKKRPNQLSGGQMQRVAIARALVNNPDIILADEPTGALDSHTSVQIMELLKEIAKTRLVIMVTHNGEMADEYSSRIIRLLDGEVQSDSNPIIEGENIVHIKEVAPKKKNKIKKTSMSMTTAISLSFKNLLTKKGRTIITSLAGSIGIIGVALVLALSHGLNLYISDMQSDALSGFPISITTTEQNYDQNTFGPMENDNSSFEEYTDKEEIYRYDKNQNSKNHTNVLTDDYLDYISNITTVLPDAVNTISYTRGVTMNILAEGESSVVKFDTNVGFSQVNTGRFDYIPAYWQEMPENQDFILSQYDLIGENSRLPVDKNEVALVVDEYNRVDENLFKKLGILEEAEKYQLTDFIDKTMLKVIPNNDYYTQDESGLFVPASTADYETLFNSDTGIKLTITAILRVKEDAPSGYLEPGIVYTTALTDYIVDDANKSDIAAAQLTSDTDVILNTPFASDDAKDKTLISLGTSTAPTGINIYPKDFDSKDNIKDYLDDYNDGKPSDDQVIYTDFAESITDMISKLLTTITYVLVGFAAISLLVSTIMIGIITYVSVIERTKEIGILRSVGARKKDISRVFNAETLIVGFSAGVLGVGISYLLTLPINMVVNKLVEIEGIANLTPVSAICLVIGSMILTLIAGLIPSSMAAKKDPVVALRTD